MEQIALLWITADELQQLISEAIAAEFEQLRSLLQSPPTHKADPTETMTRKQVEQVLQCSPPTLRKLVREGKLVPCAYVGRSPRWLRRAVEEFLSGWRKKK